MDAPILATKFNRPQARPNLVSRKRLIEKLETGLHGRLTLVSAPPGFGKSTLVIEWLEELDCAHAWLSLDPGDNDPARFFTCLAAVVRQIDPSLGLAMEAMLAAPQLPPAEVLVVTLLNAIALDCERSLLVLDDYQAITNTTIHQALSLLVERQPADLHLVLITREDPPLPLHRLRARGEMNEIRQADLRFSLEEGQAFLSASMGLELSPQAVASLVDRTEGWIAGLQMAALALQTPLADPEHGSAEQFVADFHGDDRFVMDYLMEEVFRRQPPEIQEFLLKTSILDRMNAPLCDLLLRDRGKGIGDSASPTPYPLIPSNSQSILEYLERANLFLIPLDNRREWYRYHHLFADLLRYRLERGFPKQLALLHRRACHGYRLAGDLDEAMKHAQAIPDYDLAADLAEGNLQLLIRASHIAACLGWIQQLPDEAVRPRAYLCASCAWVHILNGDFEAAARYLEYGQAGLERYEPVFSPVEGHWITLEEVKGHLSAIRAYSARLQGDFPGAIAFSQQALQELPAEALEIRCVVALNLGIVYLALWEPELAWQTQLEAYELARGSRGNRFVAVTALCQLAGIAVWRGQLREAERLCHQAFRMGTTHAGRPEELPAVAYAHGWLAAVHNQRNEIEAAKDHIEKAFELVELVGPLATLIYARLFHARLSLDESAFAEAEALLAWAEDKSRAYPTGGPVKTEWVVNRGRYYLESGDLRAAARWLSTQGVEAKDFLETVNLADDSQRWMRTRLPEYLLLARVMLARNELALAGQLLEKICTAGEVWKYEESLLEALVLRSVAAAREGGGNAARSLPYLERALNLAAPEGYVRPFLFAGEPMERLLRQAILHEIQPDYAQKLLEELSQREHRQAGRKGDLSPVEPLTGRERQVLRMLASGLNSTQIAEELVISINTARSYIKSIYGKLDAHSRVEAVNKGRQSDLL